MTAQLAPAPVFSSRDNLGFPLVGGKLFTYQAGTTTPQATYTDSTQTTPNTNPVILNFRGEAFVWLDPTLTYKFILQDAFGNLIWTEDSIPGGPFSSASGSITVPANLIPTPTNAWTLGNSTHSWAQLYLGANAVPAYDPVSGNIGYYARTAAEIAAGVTPVNFAYPPGHAWRYGAVGDGATDDTAALNRLGSINFPCYIPYTSGNGYKITGTVTFSQNNVVCDGQFYAVGIVSNSGQASGSYTATNPAVIIGGGARSLRVRGLFVEGDPNAKTNNTIAMRVDGSGHVLTECGASQCGWGSVIRGFIMQFLNCTYSFNNTGMTMYGASNPTEINSIIVCGGNYGGNSNFALNIGDSRFSTVIGGGNPQGASIRLEGFNCDNAPIQIDSVVAVSARNIYFEYGSVGTAGFILGGSGANNLKGMDIDSCFFNSMKFAVQCLNSVGGLKVGRANFYTGVTISAVKFSDMTQGCHYEIGAQSGSFGSGQQVGYNFPGQSISTLTFDGITNESDQLYNGAQIVSAVPTKWYPGAMVVAATASTRTVNVSSAKGAFYTTPATSKAGALSGNQLTMTTKSDSFFFNGGDRLTGTGAASGVAICLGVDYDNGIVTLDTTGSGAATISQVTVSTATETIP